MAEMGAEGGRFREFEDLHPGIAVTVEDDDPWATVVSACRGSAGRPRWRFGIFVETHSCSSTRNEARTMPGPVAFALRCRCLTELLSSGTRIPYSVIRMAGLVTSKVDAPSSGGVRPTAQSAPSVRIQRGDLSSIPTRGAVLRARARYRYRYRCRYCHNC